MTFQAGLFDAERRGARVRTCSPYLPESLDGRFGRVIRRVAHEELPQLDVLVVRLEGSLDELEISDWQVSYVDENGLEVHRPREHTRPRRARRASSESK
jgi:hypothetical protein